MYRYLVKCNDEIFESESFEHGNFYILKNFIKSRLYFKCHESITYVTHSDFTFLENVVPLVTRWKAPLSITVYAPGSDFNATLNAIFYLRNCFSEKELVKDFVTFHVFFEKEFYFENIHQSYKKTAEKLKCSKKLNYLKFQSNETYKALNNLPYEVNVARNLARNSSMTHLVLVSDIELYPSINFVQDFFDMLVKCFRKINLDRK